MDAAQRVLKVARSAPPGNEKIGRKRQTEEVDACTLLCQEYTQLSEFTMDEESKKLHQKILRFLLASRICNRWQLMHECLCDMIACFLVREWLFGDKPPVSEWLLSLVQLSRILLRDRELQDYLFHWGFVGNFVAFGEQAVRLYFTSVAEEATERLAVLRGFLSISQKTCIEEHINSLAEAKLHKVVASLISARDMVVAQASLQVLAQMSEANFQVRADLCHSNALDQLLQLLKESDLLTQKLSVNLMRILCSEVEAREQIKVYDGVPVLIHLLSTRNIRLQWHVAWTLAQMSEDEETAAELGHLGAIPVLLAEIKSADVPLFFKFI